MVSVELIKEAIVDREMELEQKFKNEHIIDRDNQNKISKLLSTDVALVITGARRSGKSILSYSVANKNNSAYINFEDERLNIKVEELNKVMEAIYSLKGDVDTLVFDEIQNINGWEKFVSRLIPKYKIIITGSNAKLLSKELSSSLTGRHIDFVLFPFSFKEYLRYHKIKYDYSTKSKAEIKDSLNNYISVGGFPLVYKIGPLILIETFRDIIEKDVVQRYDLKNPSLLKQIAHYLVSNIGNEISFNKIKSILNMKSVHTVKDYVEYLENPYLFFIINRFSFKLKEQMISPKKVYFIDTGMANKVSFKFMNNIGNVIENIVAIELLRRKNYSFSENEIYYYKDHQQYEIDFLIKEGTQIKELIQVTYASSYEEIPDREIRALLHAKEDLKLDDKVPLTVITWDYEDEKQIEWWKKRGKIKFIPLWKFLIQ